MRKLTLREINVENYTRTTTRMVWWHISDGFQQDSTTSDGLDPSALQKEERTSKSVMDFNSEKRSGFVGSNMGWSSGSNEGSLGVLKRLQWMAHLQLAPWTNNKYFRNVGVELKVVLAGGSVEKSLRNKMCDRSLCTASNCVMIPRSFGHICLSLYK